MINFIEYDAETKQLAESLFNMLRAKGLIDDVYQASWASLSVENKLHFYAIIDDMLEEAYDLDLDDVDNDNDDLPYGDM